MQMNFKANEYVFVSHNIGDPFRALKMTQSPNKINRWKVQEKNDNCAKTYALKLFYFFS